MGPRALVVWSIAAAASAAGAVFVTLEAQRGVATAALFEDPVLPDLRERADAVARIEIRHGEEIIRIERSDDGWIAPERFGYAVDGATVRDALRGLAELRYAAERTSIPERLVRLDLDDPGAGSAATQVVVTDAADAAVADILIGKRSEAITRDTRGTYVRHTNADQSWLASGTVDVPTNLVDWLDTDLPSLDRTAIKTLSVTPAEGEGFTVGRLAVEEDLTLTDALPEGRVTNPDAIRRLASVFAALRFDEVRPAGDVAWPERSTTLEAQTFEDVMMRVELATIDDARWVRFAEMEAWVYRLPDFQTDRMDIGLDDLLQAPGAS